jgi:hypothetical protein
MTGHMTSQGQTNSCLSLPLIWQLSVTGVTRHARGCRNPEKKKKTEKTRSCHVSRDQPVSVKIILTCKGRQSQAFRNY